MTNIEKWPEAFENGIPKVGGKWKHGGIVYVIVKTEGVVAFHNEPAGGRGKFFSGLGSFTSATFLGFADSVNQGAAAPQKPSRVEAGQAWQQPGGKVYDVAGPWEAGSPDVRLFARDATHSIGCWKADLILRDWIFVPASAPIVAPPPSLKAAVQQAGLSIPPQGTVRHEYWEACARGAEGRAEAKTYAAKAREALAADLAYDAEADAIREGRIVLKAALQEMGKGDRACFKARNLREFEAIKSAEHAQWQWWGGP